MASYSIASFNVGDWLRYHCYSLYEEYIKTTTDRKIAKIVSDFLAKVVWDDLLNNLIDHIGRELLHSGEVSVKIENPIGCVAIVGADTSNVTLHCQTKYYITQDSVSIYDTFNYDVYSHELPLSISIKLHKLFHNDDLVIILPYLHYIAESQNMVAYGNESDVQSTIKPKSLTEIKGFDFNVTTERLKMLYLSDRDKQKIIEGLKSWCEQKGCALKSVEFVEKQEE